MQAGKCFSLLCGGNELPPGMAKARGRQDAGSDE